MLLKVLCDFDGTVSVGDAVDTIFDRFAPSWLEFELLCETGEIGPAECMRRQVELMDASLDELDRALEQVEIDPAFPAFAEFCATAGISLTIVSDGVDYFIERILRKSGLHHLPVRANRLLQLAERKYTLRHPHKVRGCASDAGTCKCAHAENESGRRRTVLIGDGRSDFCVSMKADIVFAKTSLLRYTLERGISAFEYSTFADVQEVFERLCRSRPASNFAGTSLGASLEVLS
jgi:2-hydroxy-3-keto-5-methylthiopentenyl-1-phosphate phosphatase